MTNAKLRTLRLYIVEEQEIYRELYKVIFPLRVATDPLGGSTYSIEVVQVSDNKDILSIRQDVRALNPDVLLLSTKKLGKNAIAELEQIRGDNSGIGLALFLGSYSAEDIELLRKLAVTEGGGIALFLKQSLDHTSQLCGVITAVSQGQFILDPALTALLFAEKPSCPFLRELTARELEILGLLAKGYTNAGIAEALYIDVKTVEHHINSMYGKLKAAADFNDMHPRVSAARLYLEAVGELVTPAVSERVLVSAGAVR